MISMRKTGAAALAAAVVFWTPALAGDGNTLYILQDSSGGGVGNTLYVDQSAASDSTVAGDSRFPAPANGAFATPPAQQLGYGNVAEVTLTGQGGQVALYQNNAPAPGSTAEVNSATLSGGTLASLLLVQNGTGNVGSIDANGTNATAGLFQNGDFNSGSVTVTGEDARGVLIQNGNSNTYGLEVTGTGTNVTYVQNGNNVTGATVPSVTSNGGTVTITQTKF